MRREAQRGCYASTAPLPFTNCHKTRSNLHSLQYGSLPASRTSRSTAKTPRHLNNACRLYLLGYLNLSRHFFSVLSLISSTRIVCAAHLQAKPRSDLLLRDINSTSVSYIRVHSNRCNATKEGRGNWGRGGVRTRIWVWRAAHRWRVLGLLLGRGKRSPQRSLAQVRRPQWHGLIWNRLGPSFHRTLSPLSRQWR